ncbi:hypothetical protein ACGFOU_13300 [Streptomyces sp. NPDC048595]|uniref:hypothetical protein n=1 Tax=Streptomyces sp. NPDC048595 TaxID=3365576 RepID=UPI003710E8B6
MDPEVLTALFGVVGTVGGFIPIVFETLRKLREGKQADSVTIQKVNGRTSISASGRIGAVITGNSEDKRREEPILLDPANDKDVDRVLGILNDSKTDRGA